MEQKVRELNQMEYEELVRHSTKGSKQATEDIFSIGKTYLDNSQLDKAVKAFEDAAISYRISTFRNAGLLETSQSLNDKLNGHIDIFREWVLKFPKGHPTIPHMINNIDKRIVETAIYSDCRFPTDPEIIRAYKFLESALNTSNESFAGISGSRPLFVYEMMISYFGLSKPTFDFASASIDARIGIDLLALTIIENASNQDN
jgi:hypothetical protein